eukprot:g4849.t1
MHKLTSVEAQRVIAVMEDTLDKLNGLSYMPCTAKLDLLDALAEAGANPVKSCLQTQWLMEQAAIKSGAMGPLDRRSLSRHSTQLDSTQGDVPTESKGGNTVAAPAHGVNDGQQNQNRATVVIGGAADTSNGGGGGGDGLGATTLAAVGGTGAVAPADGGLLPSSGDSLEQIYQSTRTWCRTLRRYPNATEVLIAFARKNPRPQSGILFNQYLSDLTGIMYRRLSTTTANKNLLHDLTECEKLAEDERDALQQTLHATRTEKQREVGALGATIKKRREELQEVTHTNAVEMDSIKTKAAEAVAKAKEDHEKKGRALTERIERLAKETGEAAELHQQEETAARKKKAKVEVELAGVVSKYDRDMAAKTAQIEEIKAKMQEEREELAILQDHFDRVDASGRQQAAEEETLAAVRSKVAKAMGVVDGAATKIQSLFRGGRDRVEYQKAKKKAKKGGKKGKKGKNNSSSSTKKAPTAAATAALSAMLAFNVCPAEAFTPSFLVPSSRMMHHSPSFSTSLAPAAVTMACSPWDMECYGGHPFGGPGGLQRRRRMQQGRPGSMIFSPEDLFQGPAVQPEQQQFAISDPTVSRDTDGLYTLTFDLPADVDHDGLEVSVSERLLTVKARVTREEEAGPSARRGRWVTRSSRTDSVSRSFVLPEGLSTSSAAASLLPDGKAEVKFAKDQAVSGAAATATTSSKAGSTVPVNKPPSSPAVSAETGTPPAAAATAPNTAAGEPATAGSDASAAADTPAASSTTAAPAAEAERPASLPESPFDVLDQEFREFAKAMWGEEVLESFQAPTQEELAEKAAAAKEAWAKREARFAERAQAAKEAREKREARFAERFQAAKEAREKRVVAMRRATMASDVSRAEDGSSYVVRVALPEGVTRDNVKLTANSDSSLRVTVSANAEDGGRSIYKDVFLPKDALIEDVSAKFEAEQQGEEKSDSKDDVEEEADANKASGADAVSGLEVTVGRAAPPQPKTIDIL